MKTSITTDTATIVLFDPSRLRHRLADHCDWWSLPEQAVLEINAGNVLFLDTSADGIYDVEVSERLPDPEISAIEAHLINESGQFVVGPGEDVTGGDFDPTVEYGSVFLEYSPGIYRVVAWMEQELKLCLNLRKTEKFIKNSFRACPIIYGTTELID